MMKKNFFLSKRFLQQIFIEHVLCYGAIPGPGDRAGNKTSKHLHPCGSWKRGQVEWPPVVNRVLRSTNPGKTFIHKSCHQIDILR